MKFIIVFLAILVLVSGCVQQPAGQQSLASDAVVIAADSGNKTVFVEKAVTDEEQTKGLMYRESLPEDHGMLFVFNRNLPLSFWMKNTLIPLDILFINSSLVVVDIQTMELCSQTCPSYPSAAPAMYALEVNKGWAERNGVEEGDRIFLS